MPFEKGQSGNPGGRPKVIAEVKELARAHTGEAIETLVSIMTNPKSAPRPEYPLQTHCSTRLWQAAAAHHWRGWAFLRRSPARALQNSGGVGSQSGGSIGEKSLAVVHNKEPLVDSQATEASVVPQLGRETWTTKIKIRVPLIQAWARLGALWVGPRLAPGAQH